MTLGGRNFELAKLVPEVLPRSVIFTSMSPVSKDQTSSPVTASHTWINPPMSAVARYLESWLKPVQVTVSLWPVGRGRGREGEGGSV